MKEYLIDMGFLFGTLTPYGMAIASGGGWPLVLGCFVSVVVAGFAKNYYKKL